MYKTGAQRRLLAAQSIHHYLKPWSASHRALTTSTPRAMPLYACYCPDYEAEGTIDKRLKVREGHLKRAEQDKKEGQSGEWRLLCRGTTKRCGTVYR